MTTTPKNHAKVQLVWYAYAKGDDAYKRLLLDAGFANIDEFLEFVEQKKTEFNDALPELQKWKHK